MMSLLVAVPDLNLAFRVAMACLMFVAATLMVLWAWRPLRAYLGKQEAMYDRVLRGSLLLDVNPRTVTWAGIGGVVLLAMLGYAAIHHVLAAAVGAAIGMILPPVLVRYLKGRRLYQLEEQLVDGIQTLVSEIGRAHV
jgi:high-affinity Fe2+/Pb2+ permease